MNEDKLDKREQERFMDNWKHRSNGAVCSTCMWNVKKEKENEESGEIGRCRKHSPTLGGWPVVFATDWCGDHKVDENKITDL